MKAPSNAALLVLAGLCFDTPVCLAANKQDPLKVNAAKYKACPAYENYARYLQYG